MAELKPCPFCGGEAELRRTIGQCLEGGERGMSGITRDEFIDEICKRCTVDQRVKTGILTEDDAREECDCCACIMIAGMICDAAGIE